MGRRRSRVGGGPPVSADLTQLVRQHNALAEAAGVFQPLPLGEFQSRMGPGLAEILIDRAKTQLVAMEAQMKNPLPSAPTRPGKYCIRAQRGESFCAHVFAEMYAAKKWMETLIEDNDTRWLNDDRLAVMSDPEIIMWGDAIQDVMEYEPTAEESAWELPQPYSGYARQFLGRRYLSDSVPMGDNIEPVVKEKRAKVSREGLVTIQAICEDLQVEPRRARQVFRKLKWQKPDAGWAWPAEEVERVKDTLRSTL